MLENYPEVIAEITQYDKAITLDNKTIHAILKRHLTRKELKTFLSIKEGVDKNVIAENLGVDLERLELLYNQAVAKIKRPKIIQELKREVDNG